jgi:hypothetical protein
MFKILLKKQNWQWLLFLALIISSSLFIAKKSSMFHDWGNIISMDGRGYYAYLPAVFIFHDLGLDFYQKNSPVAGDEANFLVSVNGGKINKYSYGVSLALLPFFLIGWAYSFFAGYPLTGYSQPFYHAVLFGAVFYLCLGLYYLRRLLQILEIKPVLIYLVLTLIFFATNLFHYTVFEPSMSHVYSFAAVSAFCFFTVNFFQKNNTRSFFWMAVTFALIIIIRPVNALIVLAIPFLAGSFNNIVFSLSSLFSKHTKQAIIGLIVFSFIIGIQCLLWYLQAGSWFFYSYGNEGFAFFDPQIWNVLFSYRKGLFIYTPLLFLGLFGLFPLFQKNRFGFAASMFFLTVMVYIFSSWKNWHYGWSFGQRGFIDFYPFFAILLALFFNHLTSKLAKSLAIAASLFVFVLSAVQTFQLKNQILLSEGMEKDSYWEVFLKTDLRYAGLLEEKEKQKFSAYYKNKISDLSPVFKSKITFDEPVVPAFWELGLVKQGNAYSGQMANLAGTSATFYSAGFTAKLSEISPLPIKYIHASARIFQNLKPAPYFLIISVESSGKLIQYNSLDLKRMSANKGQWALKEFIVPMPESDPADTFVKVYIGSTKGSEVLIDDFELAFY